MATNASSSSALLEALTSLAQAAQANIPGTDFASITVRDADESLRTLATTDPWAENADALQYEFREGPCYAAVTEDRFVLVTDMAAATHDYPSFAPRAAELGVRAQAAVQLLQDGERAGLNLYALRRGAFDSSTIQFAELFASQAAALLGYAVQVEQLSEALHTRTDIATAVGIVMEPPRPPQRARSAWQGHQGGAARRRPRWTAQPNVPPTWVHGDVLAPAGLIGPNRGQ